MTMIRSLTVASVIFAANFGIFSAPADAFGPPLNTNPNADCTPFEVHHNIWHQRCVVRDTNGLELYVYYIDQNGQWYRLAD